MVFLVSIFLLACSPGETLPRVEVGDGARLEFKSTELEPISLSSKEDIDKFLAFYNERLGV